MTFHSRASVAPRRDPRGARGEEEREVTRWRRRRRRRRRCPSVSRPPPRGHEVDSLLHAAQDDDRDVAASRSRITRRDLSLSPSASGRTDGRTDPARTLEIHPLYTAKTSERTSESERGSCDPTQRGGLDRAERRDERMCPRRGHRRSGPGPGPYDPARDARWKTRHSDLHLTRIPGTYMEPDCDEGTKVPFP
ncbi:uncharacterized protein LOC105425907 isoform X2 [Pogonomyrmex barbatus]|uniref:Uncharacterized protein LOC105425907 isoform X2 n=1 Tax=Pogonomyrmex barbatus TaxID=144034 RepID=A0A8N1S4V3_9HYME|nr:uncharacterized protein LOC105425907 isoform X2 [Pogonomyrmex barbatus]